MPLCRDPHRSPKSVSPRDDASDPRWPSITARRALSADLSITQRISRQAAEPWLPGIGQEMSNTTLTVPGVNEPPSHHDITIRVATETGRHPDPAAFAVTASRAPTGRNGQEREHPQRAYCRGDHLRSQRPRGHRAGSDRRRPGYCRRGAQGRGSGVVTQPVKSGTRCRARARERRLPELVVPGNASDRHVSHAPAASCGFPGRPQMRGFQLTCALPGHSS
jgi:hypothetical protein